jgi:hypothetical protein
LLPPLHEWLNRHLHQAHLGAAKAVQIGTHPAGITDKRTVRNAMVGGGQYLSRTM